MIQTQEKTLITESPNEEDLSALTLDQIISKSEEVYQRWEELCYKIDQENFCTDCEFIVILNEREEYWGSTCYRQVPSCRAEFNPEDGLCQRQEEYEELVEQKEAKEAELEQLEALLEMLENGEGAKGV